MMWRQVFLGASLVMVAPATSLAPPPSVIAVDAFEVYADGFDDVRGIAVDDEGNVFVAERGTGTVTRIAPDRSHSIIASRLELPTGLALDREGRLLIVEERAGRVVRVEPDGRRTTLIADVKRPRWLAVSDDGTVFVSARRIAGDSDPEPDEESVEPEVVMALLPNGMLSVFADGFRNLQGLAASHTALFLATQGLKGDTHVDGVVLQMQIPPDGTAGTPTRVGPSDRYRKPVGLGRDRLGALYLTTREIDLLEDGSKRTIAKLHSTGAVTPYAENLDDPQGIAFDANGNLYVADGNSGRVLRFHAPPPPALTTPAATNRSPLAVTGMARQADRVDLFVGDATTPITVTADGAGAFAASVALASNASNAIEAFATSRGGQGLTSRPVDVVVVHDSIAPGLSFQAPPAGYVRGSIRVQVQAMDAGTGVRALALTVDGQSLQPTLAPVWPGARTTAIVAWDTTSVADGTHTLRATATDGVGNTSVATRIVIVDNTPPDTQITGGPAGATSEPTATFTFAGRDNLAPVGSLTYAWRLDGGALTEFAATMSTTFTNLASGPHTFEVIARDPAGNVDPTPAVAMFTTGGALQVRITTPVAGAAVPSGALLVQGTVVAGGAETGVAVNGVPAAVQTGVFAALVPVRPGVVLLTAVATTSGGARGDHSVSITVTETGVGASLVALPQSGPAPLSVTFTLLDGSGGMIALDADGDGATDFTGPRLEGQTFTFARPGIYFPAATISAGSGTQVTAQSIVQVYDRAALDAFFQAKWGAMRSALIANDFAGAVAHFAAPQRDRYRALFTALIGDIAQIARDMQPIEQIYVVEGLAKYRLPRTQLWGGRLMTITYYVYFVQDGDGLWTIESF